jgi:hypothetical protein
MQRGGQGQMTRIEKDAEEMKRKNAGKVNKNASQ